MVLHKAWIVVSDVLCPCNPSLAGSARAPGSAWLWGRAGKLYVRLLCSSAPGALCQDQLQPSGSMWVHMARAPV